MWKTQGKGTIGFNCNIISRALTLPVLIIKAKKPHIQDKKLAHYVSRGILHGV